MKTVTKSFLRYLIRRRSLSLLQLFGIACGVAAVIGMSMSARSALVSFAGAIEFLRGKATHSIERRAGPMEETMLSALMNDPAVEHFSPVIDRRLRLWDGEPVRFLGVDVFPDRVMRPEIASAYMERQGRSDPSEAFAFLLEDRAVMVDQGLASRLRLKAGDMMETSGGELKVTGTFSNPAGEPLILMDIGHAQKLLGLEGRVDHVDLILNDEAGFRSRWESGFQIQSVRQRSQTLSAMLNAFRLNLEALSLLALFVGVFLIYNTAMFAVVSRRRDAGILRSLGATPGEIVRAFLTEILLLGILGGILGSLFGYILSRFLTGLVGSTVSSLYFFLKPRPLPWSISMAFAGMVLGAGASLLGSFFPLRETVRLDPIQTLRGKVTGRKERRDARRLALAGIAVLVVSAGLLPFTGYYVYIGFVGVFGILIGASFLTGVMLLAAGPPLTKVLVAIWGLPGKVAAGTLQHNLGRTTVAVAAFAIALSLSIGLGSMIGSFRESLHWWMDAQLRGDFYLGTPEEIVPAGFYEEIRNIPGLEGSVDPFRNVQILYQGKPVSVKAIDASVLQRKTRFGWYKGSDRNWDDVKQGDVIVSESFARGFGTGVGNHVRLQGNSGPFELRIAAVFYDYASEHGVIIMDRSTYLKVYNDSTINSVVVFIGAGNPRYRALSVEVKERALKWGVPVLTRDQLHGKILAVFESTFAVTRSMRVMAIIVAFFGIAGALLTLYMERQKEFGIYRALGFSTAQVAGMTLIEGIAMGIVSFLMSMIVGTVLAVVLIKVINLHSFNWTIFYFFTWQPYAMAALTALLASAGAALYPIWKVFRTYPQMQIREE